MARERGARKSVAGQSRTKGLHRARRSVGVRMVWMRCIWARTSRSAGGNIESSVDEGEREHTHPERRGTSGPGG